MTRGRNTLIVRCGRMLQHFPLAWLRIIELPFVNMRCQKSCDPTLIFLLAIPRSGSTLTLQLLTHRFSSRYLSNVGNLLFHLPFFGALLTSIFCGKYKSDFKSHLGFVQGMCGPAEGLRFWNYWTGYDIDERNPPIEESKTRTKRLLYLRKVLGSLTHQSLPMINGFLGHSLQSRRLQVEFPNAIYIRLYRNPLRNALSLLQCRQRTGNAWFSLFPSECASYVGTGIYMEVASQVYWLNRRLDEQLNGDNVFCLDYEGLCRDPIKNLRKLQEFCKERGVLLTINNDIPHFFEQTVVNIDENEDAKLLKIALDDLEKRNGKLKHWNACS